MWPELKERLRQPAHMMALMRGVLGGDAEVAAVTAVNPTGVVRPLAILVTPAIEAEIELSGEESSSDEQVGSRRPGRIGDYEVEVLLGEVGGERRPVAILMTPWIFEHLTLYTRKLWSRR